MQIRNRGAAQESEKALSPFEFPNSGFSEVRAGKSWLSSEPSPDSDLRQRGRV